MITMQNQELYNHEDIHDDLARRGHRFTSRCDTEILPHLLRGRGRQLRGAPQGQVWHRRILFNVAAVR